MPTLQNVLKENVLADEELLTHVILPAPGNVKSGHYEVRYKAVARLAACVHDGRPGDERQHDPVGARRARRGRAGAVALEDGRATRWPASRSTSRPPRWPAKRPCATRSR